MVRERNGDDVCSLSRVRICSRLRDEYRCSFPVGLNVMSATSQPHRIESSIAFLNAPTRRFAKVHCSRVCRKGNRKLMKHGKVKRDVGKGGTHLPCALVGDA